MQSLGNMNLLKEIIKVMEIMNDYITDRWEMYPFVCIMFMKMRKRYGMETEHGMEALKKPSYTIQIKILEMDGSSTAWKTQQF